MRTTLRINDQRATSLARTIADRIIADGAIWLIIVGDENEASDRLNEVIKSIAIANGKTVPIGKTIYFRVNELGEKKDEGYQLDVFCPRHW